MPCANAISPSWPSRRMPVARRGSVISNRSHRMASRTIDPRQRVSCQSQAHRWRRQRPAFTAELATERTRSSLHRAATCTSASNRAQTRRRPPHAGLVQAVARGIGTRSSSPCGWQRRQIRDTGGCQRPVQPRRLAAGLTVAGMAFFEQHGQICPAPLDPVRPGPRLFRHTATTPSPSMPCGSRQAAPLSVTGAPIGRLAWTQRILAIT